MERDDNPGLYLCMANDILEKEFLGREVEQVRQEAQQAMKVKSEFVANVTHELRTPVNGILGNARELLDFVTDEKILKSLRLIERCCGDMNKIINNILDFSKLEAGKFTLEPRRFHFRNMLNYIKSQHQAKNTEKGLGFFITVSPQVPEYLIGDELRVGQLLNNLLSNAKKYTSIGKITVEVTGGIYFLSDHKSCHPERVWSSSGQVCVILAESRVVKRCQLVLVLLRKR